MKTVHTRIITFLLIVAIFFYSSTSADAQNRRSRRTVTTSRKTNVSTPQRPSAPTPISQKNRTIKDLLYFPFGCLPSTVTTSEAAEDLLTKEFGNYENVNGYIGLHKNAVFDFTYKGKTIGLCFYDWYDYRQWYEFYFDTRSEAQQFYTVLTNDIKQAGIPLTPDKIYGGLSTRKRPISVFKEIYVFPASYIKEADKSNIRREEEVGKYVIEMGVYRRVK